MPARCYPSGLLAIEQAQEIITTIIQPITAKESCPLSDALDRVLAEDIISPINVPNYDNSAMDGYAFSYTDNEHDRFIIVGESFAGSPYQGRVKKGECVRIMTGAAIPDGADTVMMQENTEQEDRYIRLTTPPKKGDAIRKAGSDITRGDCVLPQGKRISPIDIGLLSSLGFTHVPVYKKIKVAVFSTGDELQAQGEDNKTYHLYDSNRPMLIAMLNRIGAEVINLGIIKDNKEAIRQAFDTADLRADCVITSGGVSVGDADYTREVLNEIGRVDFWKLAIKPGKPLAFGRLDNSTFFGLPGNPVSAAVTFDKIVMPALQQLSGETLKCKPTLSAIASCDIRKKLGRMDFQRGICERDKNGQLQVQPSGSQSSGVLSSFSKSNCYIVLERERGHIKAGEQVTIELFDKSLQ